MEAVKPPTPPRGKAPVRTCPSSGPSGHSETPGAQWSCRTMRARAGQVQAWISLEDLFSFPHLKMGGGTLILAGSPWSLRQWSSSIISIEMFSFPPWTQIASISDFIAFRNGSLVATTCQDRIHIGLGHIETESRRRIVAAGLPSRIPLALTVFGPCTKFRHADCSSEEIVQTASVLVGAVTLGWRLCCCRR